MSVGVRPDPPISVGMGVWSPAGEDGKLLGYSVSYRTEKAALDDPGLSLSLETRREQLVVVAWLGCADFGTVPHGVGFVVGSAVRGLVLSVGVDLRAAHSWWASAGCLLLGDRFAVSGMFWAVLVVRGVESVGAVSESGWFRGPAGWVWKGGISDPAVPNRREVLPKVDGGLLYLQGGYPAVVRYLRAGVPPVLLCSAGLRGWPTTAWTAHVARWSCSTSPLLPVA